MAFTSCTAVRSAGFLVLAPGWDGDQRSGDLIAPVGPHDQLLDDTAPARSNAVGFHAPQSAGIRSALVRRGGARRCAVWPVTISIEGFRMRTTVTMILASVVILLVFAAAGPAAPHKSDLTGRWSCDDGGTYYLRQVGV